MAEGVENSYIVLFLMNREYYQSKYCEKGKRFRIDSSTVCGSLVDAVS